MIVDVRTQTTARIARRRQIRAIARGDVEYFAFVGAPHECFRVANGNAHERVLIRRAFQRQHQTAYQRCHA